MGLEFPLTDPVVEFAVVAAIALVVKLTFERFHIPAVIGLLLAGLLLGPGGLELLSKEPVVDLFGRIGLVYIMFLAGMEIDLGIVRQHKSETVAFGLLAFACSFAPAFGVGLLLGLSYPAAALLGTLLSSHTLLAYPIVERLGLLKRQSVVVAVGGTVVTDTLALILLAVTIQIGGEAEDWPWWLPLVLLAGMSAASIWGLPKVSRYIFQQKEVTRAEKSLYVLVVLLALSTLAEAIGTDEILGAFLAGLCLNQTLWDFEELSEHVEFAGNMLFVPFFFVATGMLLSFQVLMGDAWVWILAGIMTAIVLFGKTVAAWGLGWWYGYEWRDRLLMAGLTLPQAAATLAVTTTAHDAGLFGTEMVDAVILLIFITCLAGPLATHFMGTQVAENQNNRGEQEQRP